MRKLLPFLLFFSACNTNFQDILGNLKVPPALATPTAVPSLSLPTIPPVLPTSLPTSAPSAPVPTVAATPTRLSGVPFSGKCTEVRSYSSNWRANRFLWKPSAEHVGYPVVVLLSDVNIVQVLDQNKKVIVKLPFRSYGSAGYAYQDYSLSGAALKKKYTSIWVHTAVVKGCHDYFIKDPTKRSDGLNK